MKMNECWKDKNWYSSVMESNIKSNYITNGWYVYSHAIVISALMIRYSFSAQIEAYATRWQVARVDAVVRLGCQLGCEEGKGMIASIGQV